MAKQKYAVIGHPIGHTMSPFIHKRLFSLSGIDAEYSVSKTTHSNYVNAFNKKYQYLNNTLRIISGESIKGGTFATYIRNPLLVLSGLIMDKYKKILFTDIKGNTFIVNNVKWLYQYVSSKNINTEPRIYG